MVKTTALTVCVKILHYLECNFQAFIYILREAFMVIDPESVKKIDNLTVIFTHLGSVHLKAARKMLMKFSPGQFDL